MVVVSAPGSDLEVRSTKMNPQEKTILSPIDY